MKRGLYPENITKLVKAVEQEYERFKYKMLSKTVSAKYSCGFSNPLVPSIIVGERYLDYFTTITEDRL